ncbi:MAG: hypothetical protein IJV00_03520 [Clostridia bacterium]|nr:hypothetical protein [Clostridia bacterium]
MKNKSDPDLRFIEALSELDGPLIGEFLDTEQRLAKRRGAGRARRLAALAACLIVAIGAGMVIFTEGAPENKTVPKNPITDPARETEEPPRKTQTADAQNPKTKERRIIYADDSAVKPHGTGVEMNYATPHNQNKGTVFCYNALLEALEENTSDDDIFAVIIFAKESDEFYKKRGIATHSDDLSICGSYWKAEREIENKYFLLHIENSIIHSETDENCELCREENEKLKELRKNVIEKLYGTDSEVDFYDFYYCIGTKAYKERKAAFEGFMSDYLASYGIAFEGFIENYAQWTRKNTPGYSENYPEYTHFDSYCASVKVTKTQLKELISCKNFDLFPDAKEMAWSLELASEKVEDHDPYRYARSRIENEKENCGRDFLVECY